METIPPTFDGELIDLSDIRLDSLPSDGSVFIHELRRILAETEQQDEAFAKFSNLIS